MKGRGGEGSQEKERAETGMVVCACSFSSQEMEAEGSGIWSISSQYRSICVNRDTPMDIRVEVEGLQLQMQTGLHSELKASLGYAV